MEMNQIQIQETPKGDENQTPIADRLSSPRPALERLFMCRIPPIGGEKCHVVGEIGESDPANEPSRAFWTNASVKALMGQTAQPKYISACKKVRGDWRSIQVSRVPFAGDVCRRCAALALVAKEGNAAN